MFSYKTLVHTPNGRLAGASTLAVALFAAGTAAPAAPAKPSPRNAVKGQGQLAGQSAEFGVVYSLQNGFNFAINAARYTVEPFIGSGAPTAGTAEKLVVMEFAIKNTSPSDNWFGTEGLFTLVDEKGQLYDARSVALESQGSEAPSMTLRPGQGLGQAALKDPLLAAFTVPARARIVKLMVNQWAYDVSAVK